MKSAKLKWLGGQRLTVSNKFLVTCPHCGHSWEALAATDHQTVSCSRCRKAAIADYSKTLKSVGVTL